MQVTKTKTKIDKWDCIKLKRIFTAKGENNLYKIKQLTEMVGNIASPQTFLDKMAG